ncbi:hypothetical protein C8R44DRAFT_729876 [Mycena epipterygia]|nr:hypothetical protein C8R44DRAFT_729876 [Mycena epipterygia]
MPSSFPLLAFLHPETWHVQALRSDTLPFCCVFEPGGWKEGGAGKNACAAVRMRASRNACGRARARRHSCLQVLAHAERAAWGRARSRRQECLRAGGAQPRRKGARAGNPAEDGLMQAFLPAGAHAEGPACGAGILPAPLGRRDPVRRSRR